MADVHEDIRNWLHQQQDWLQEAAEKLLVLGSLTQGDIETIAKCLKTSAGQKVTKHHAFAGLGTAPECATELRLIAIDDICGIENLCPTNPLEFGKGNLAVIYGPNGSGKSGYTRIIKRACGKPGASDLKSNVFEAPPATRQCRITYTLAERASRVTWHPDGAPVDDIRAVDIFDADAASFYLGKESEASYTPPAVIFKALADACDRVKKTLQEEQDRLVSKLPTLPPGYGATTAGKAYSTLSLDLSEQAIQRLTKWGEDDKETLSQLAERLSASDPVILAQKKRRTKNQLEELGAQLRNAAIAVGTQQVDALRNARGEAHQKRKVASEATEIGSAKLDGIGTATWNALWQAARAYSQMAYPGLDYPVTQDDARCVLCHQQLAQDAQERLRDFEAFVQGAVETEAKVAEEAYKTALASLPKGWNDEEIRTRCEAAGLSEEGWTEKLWDFWVKVAEARECLLSGETGEKYVAVESPDDLLNNLRQRTEALEREALQNDEDAKNFDRQKVRKGQLSFEAQRWMYQQADPIRVEIARLKKINAYEDWKRLANSRNISLKAAEITEQVITREYVARFNHEISALGASQIKVELIKTRTEKGRALHGLRLKGIHSEHDLPRTVLSEGEHRIVALAAFLADVAEKPQVAPFIFDDPISSLDQDFEWHVARRLAKLARSRQVLVFTHRLSLYGAMEDAAKKVGDDWKKKHLVQRCIESFSGVAGHPADETVWNAKTKNANNILLARLDKARGVSETDGAGAYRIHAQGICTDFRKLLERTVEDDLLNQVVKRHRRSVTTENRLVPLPHITRKDCNFLDELMTKYSYYEHSQSQEAPISLPEEPELRKDLESLKTWREDFKNRSAEVSA